MERRPPRILIHRKAWLRQDAGTYRRVQTIDLSAGGAQIALEDPLLSGTPLDLCFKLDPGAPLAVRAVVVWCRPDAQGGFRVGLAFPRQQSLDARQLVRWHHIRSLGLAA